MECVHCGCSDERACEGGCAWVVQGPDGKGLCSACEESTNGPALVAIALDISGLSVVPFPDNDGPAFCWFMTEYPEEGVCAPFDSFLEAAGHALATSPPASL